MPFSRRRSEPGGGVEVAGTARGLAPWTVGAAAMFACGWGGNQFTPLLAMYRSHNGFSEVTVDALLAAYVLGLAPALLVGGGLSDRHGRRRLMIVALIGCLLGSLSLSADNLASLAVGRLLSGVGIGLAMAVGTTWVVELSFAAGLPAALGARRASLSLTAGLGVGPAVAGLLAQFGPLPASLPYWVHVTVTLPLLALVVGVGVETAGDIIRPTRTRPRTPLLPRAICDPRFRRRILPTAPWIFGAAGIAYATVPEAVDGRVGHLALLYATILTVTAMAAGFLVQPLAQRLEHPELPRAQSVAMAVTCAGMALAAVTVALQLAWVGGLICAVTLGSALGLTMSSGLQEIQRLADPAELARSTGIFYALAYIGFLAPMLIAISGQTAAALWCLTGLAGGCGLFVVAASARQPRLSPRTSASPS